MPFTPPDDYWLEIPGGRYTIGLLPDEARRLAEQSAEWTRFVGPTFSLNDAKNLARHFEIEEETGNVEWVTEYLLAHFPAREVELAPFAIARRPITVAEYRAFMAERGESEPKSFETPDNLQPDRPARGIAWTAAIAFVEWAGARLPFEAEWEVAARGLERRLFPWGNEFRPIADWLLTGYESVVPPLDPRTFTPTGIQGMLNRGEEWCADLWHEPAGLDLARWNEQARSLEHRCIRGGDVGKVIPSAVSRDPGYTLSYTCRTTGVRLVRADGRPIPAGVDPSRDDRAFLDVRSFEHKTVRPAFESLRTSRLAQNHTLTPEAGDRYLSDPAVGSLTVEISRIHASVRGGFDADATKAAGEYRFGLFLVARSTETFRRIPPEHGIFVWNIQYRLAEDGRVRARPVAVYRMAFNKRFHEFVMSFRAGEPDTPIQDITQEMIRISVSEAFRFYETYADADVSPF